MDSRVIRLLLADDDKDDCVLFKDALEELALPVTLEIAGDGEMLMEILNDGERQLPDILFLDLNMPRKNGFECLLEIKRVNHLFDLPVIIFSTSFDPDIVEMLQKKGARHYIRKPNEFGKLKAAINRAIGSIKNGSVSLTTQEDFILPY